ncbi:MAG: PorV/PorQ family protein [Balneolaceae bacterium]
MKSTIFSLLIVLLIVPSLIAQDSGSGLDFLNVGPSARLLSIADATAATPVGASAVYSNPALLVMESESSVDVNYTSWVAGVENQFAAVNFHRGRYALGFGVYSSRSDGFEARERPGESDGDFAVSYLSLAGSFAYRINNLSAGITLQYLREEIFELRASGFAVSVGVNAFLFDERVRIGAAVQNAGEMDDLDFESTTLPSQFRIGTAIDLLEVNTPGRNDLPILFSVHADYITPIEDVTTSDFINRSSTDFFSLAGRARVANLFYLQGGYKFGNTERPVSLGAGIILSPITVNYALVPFTTGFGTAHSIGIQFYF